MLRAFPFRTFDEIAALGLEVEIYCPSCYRYSSAPIVGAAPSLATAPGAST